MRTLALERQVAAAEQREKEQKEREPSSIGTRARELSSTWKWLNHWADVRSLHENVVIYEGHATCIINRQCAPSCAIAECKERIQQFHFFFLNRLLIIVTKKLFR